jgi:putative endonuclease
MSEASDLGKKGEALAAEHLLNNGYKLLEKNFGRGNAEVDIIAAANDRIVFVEVKTRRSTFLNDPGFMVPVQKQKQIFKAANSFLKMHNIELPARFDIISIVLNPDITKIEHYEGAFYPSIY